MKRRSILVTFYSFKGGVGRTQALANVAVALANRGRDVVVVDMDLESPGLHNYFRPKDEAHGHPFQEQDLANIPGLIDFLEICNGRPEDEPRVEGLLVECTHAAHRLGRLRLLTAGRIDDEYPRRVAGFSWERFYEESYGYSYMELLRDQLLACGADFVLVDSRTGMTDVGYVCTFQIPDVVVILFALHAQGIDGARRARDAILRQRNVRSGESRPEQILLVPARVEEAGDIKSFTDWMRSVRERLGGDDGPARLLAEHGQRVPYLAQVAYGEQIVMAPDAERNVLSQAYDHLTGYLDDIATRPAEGAPDPELVAARAADMQIETLRSSLESMRRRVRELAERVGGHAPARDSLNGLASWAHRIGSLHALLQEELRRIQDSIGWLHVEAGQGEPPVAAVPDTLPQWEQLLPGLEREAEAAYEVWYRARQRALREQLREAAHGDARLVDEALQRLDAMLREGKTAELELRLPGIEEELRRSSLDDLLRRGRLTGETLTRRLPDKASQRMWLDQRLQRLLEEGIPDDGAMPVELRNLLRLRTELLDRPARNDWTAYDLLCLMVNERQDSVGCFEEIGQRMWLRAWQEVFERSFAEADLPAGNDSREHLRLVSEKRPELLQSIVAVIARGLAGRFAEGGNEELDRLLRTQRDDPALRMALLRIGEDRQQPPRVRAGVLALGLRAPASMPVELIPPFLQAVLDNQTFAEAFYALCAFMRIGAIDVAEPGLGAVSCDVLAAFLVSSLRNDSNTAGGRQLIEDSDARGLLQRSRAGLGLLAGLAGDLLTLGSPSEMADMLRQEIIYSEPVARRLPDEVRNWLREAEQGGSFDAGVTAEANRLVMRLREKASTHIYGSWRGSVYYEQHFQRFWNQEIDKLLRERRPSQLIANEIARLDAGDWIEKTARKVQESEKRHGNPDGSARDKLAHIFEEQVEDLVRLNGLRERLDGATLEEMIAGLDARHHAARSLECWLLEEQGQSATVCAAVAQFVQMEGGHVA